MGYQAADTFDYYNTTQLQAGIYYENVGIGNGSTPIVSSAYARNAAIGSFPNQGVHLDTNAYLRKNLKSSQGTLIVFRTYGCGVLPLGTYATVISLLDSGTGQMSLAVNPAGGLQFGYYGHSEYPVFTPVGPASANGLISTSSVPNHGIEIEVTISPTVGTVQCWLDGVQVIPLTTGLCTQSYYSSHSSANQVQLGYASGSWSNIVGLAEYCDYVRIWDNTGTTQNAPTQKDARKLTKIASGTGVYSQWTANGTTPNYNCTNKVPAQTVDYVSGATVGIYDSYGMGNAGLTVNPNMVLARSYAKKVDSAVHTIEIGVLGAGATIGLGTTYTLTSGYVYTDACIATAPATGNPPLAAAADAFQHLKYLSE